MDSLLNPLLSYLLLYKYITLALVVYIGAVGAPLPVNAMLLALGAFASQGYFSFWLSLLVSVVFNTFGDLTGYGLAKKFGTRVIDALHIKKAQFFKNLEEELHTDAAVTVFITRFAGSLSSIANILAGMANVPLLTFLIYDFLGNVIEPLAALSLGYLVGNYWSDFSSFFSIGAGLFAVGIIMFVLIRMQKRLAKKYTKENQGAL
jgi:membrane protein DedA with SNARE-associated domain